MKEQQKRDPKAQEHQSLRLGHQERTREAVVNAKEDKSCLQRARKQRFDSTEEPEAAPSAAKS